MHNFYFESNVNYRMDMERKKMIPKRDRENKHQNGLEKWQEMQNDIQLMREQSSSGFILCDQV